MLKRHERAYIWNNPDPDQRVAIDLNFEVVVLRNRKFRRSGELLSSPQGAPKDVDEGYIYRWPAI